MNAKNIAAEVAAAGGIAMAWLSDVQQVVGIVAGLLAAVWYVINIRRALKNKKPTGDD